MFIHRVTGLRNDCFSFTKLIYNSGHWGRGTHQYQRESITTTHQPTIQSMDQLLCVLLCLECVALQQSRGMQTLCTGKKKKKRDTRNCEVQITPICSFFPALSSLQSSKSRHEKATKITLKDNKTPTDKT